MLLIINSDDFGYCKNRNEGIVHGFLHGCVTSTTVLINAAEAEHARDLAHKHNIPVGLHINVTEGRPVSDPARVSSLLTSEGFFRGKFAFFEALDSGLIDPEEVSLWKLENSLDVVVGVSCDACCCECFCKKLLASFLFHSLFSVLQR
jgi:predicted glycoside hydrolase/deacetylase ChbG (UPF0249 family)